MKLLSMAIILAGSASIAHAETFEAFSAPGFTTETSNLAGYYFTPIGAPGDEVKSFSVLSTAAGFATSATITFAAPVTSYTFLWGSPDSYNFVSDGAVVVNGSSVGNNVYTFADSAGFSALTFRTTGVAFELAQVSAVPEPNSSALVLAGLACFAAVGYARKKQNG